MVRCNHCRHYQVAFGNMALSFTGDQYLEFMDTVTEYYEQNKNCSNPDLKSIQIPTIVRSIMLVFSTKELGQLFVLLNQAKSELQRESLYTFHEN